MVECKDTLGSTFPAYQMIGHKSNRLTALGINNSGELTMTYGKEDIDYRTDGDASSGYIFNAAENTFWRRIRDLMQSQLSVMYQTLDSSNCWSSDSLIEQFDNWQGQFPEELWRLDIERKYYRTYRGEGLNAGNTPSPTPRYLQEMMNGRKKYQRRQFERDQAAYMGTKYLSSSILADKIEFRCNTPINAVVTPNYDLTITPYSDMYLSVKFGNTSPVQIRAKAGTQYTVECPIVGNMDDTMFVIYCASRIQALNDISACYIHDNDFSSASKLQILKIGNTTVGYANSFLTTLNLGDNPLLESLDIRNCPNLAGSLNLASCVNLETLRAEGTAITAVTFANYGKIKDAYLPNTVKTLVMKNLNYLTNLNVSLNNIEALTEENSVVDELDMVEDTIDTLQSLRLVGINWTLSDTTLLNQIYALNSSYLSGTVYVSGQVRSQELVNYASKWNDLTVTYELANLVPQHKITYVNADSQNTVLYEVYVDQGSTPPDPYATGAISMPTLASTPQYTYSFGTVTDGQYVSGSGWNEISSVVLAPRTVTAVYTTTTRTYTVTWYSRPGLQIGQPVTASYGSEVVYQGDIPTNTSEEGTYIFNVFKGWDKSTGYIKADTNVYAVWERSELPEVGTDLSEMDEGEIFAVTSSGRASSYFEAKDYTDIYLGNDFNFSNVDSEELVSVTNPQYFNGSTAYNSQRSGTNNNIKLFGSGETSFTIAIDLNFLSTETNNTLLACFEEDGSEGFRVRYNGNINVQWGDVNTSIGYQKFRDIVVLRHIKGDNKLYVYASNTNNSSSSFSDSIARIELTRTRSTNTEALLSLGAIRFLGDGGFDDYGTGMINWCKIWFDDLGDTNAKALAAWCREKIRMEYVGSSKYRLAGNTSQRASASFIANNLLANRGHNMNTANSNSGGWNGSLMRTFCNSRLYAALPTVWKSMVKKVKISASAGSSSSEIIVSEDYVYLHSVKEVDNGQTNAVYTSEGDFISWYTSNIQRAKFYGRIIPDTASRYTSSADPQTVSSNNVQVGDVWQPNGGNNTNYIFVSRQEIDRFGLTTKSTPTALGEWVSASHWWLRSPNVGDSTSFWYVAGVGYTGNYYANLVYGVCPCFSI